MVLTSLCETTSHAYVSTATTGWKLFPFSLHYTCTGRRYSRQLHLTDCPSWELLLLSRLNFSRNFNNALQKKKKGDGMGASLGKASNIPCLFHLLTNTLKFDSGCPCNFPKVSGLCKAVMYHSISFWGFILIWHISQRDLWQQGIQLTARTSDPKGNVQLLFFAILNPLCNQRNH